MRVFALSPYCGETVEGQRGGSWPPASVTLTVAEGKERGSSSGRRAIHTHTRALKSTHTHKRAHTERESISKSCMCAFFCLAAQFSRSAGLELGNP